jgi:hypothetical protein
VISDLRVFLRAMPVLLGGDGALVEVELPAIVAEGPERGAVGDCDGSGDAVGGEDNILCELRDVKVMDGRWARGAGEQDVDGLLAIEDAAGGTELLVLFREQWDQSSSVGLAVGVEETLFERVKVILKFGCFHESSSVYYTNRNAKGFIMPDLEDAKGLKFFGRARREESPEDPRRSRRLANRIVVRRARPAGRVRSQGRADHRV